MRTKEHYFKKVSLVNGCWVWGGASFKDGYGKINIGNGVMRLAHRIFYELYNSDIKPGLVIDHLCENKSCVNPKHLEQVTQLENMQRYFSKPRPNCPQGHLYDLKNTYINPLGRKICRKCTNISGKKYRNKKKNEVRSS